MRSWDGIAVIRLHQDFILYVFFPFCALLNYVLLISTTEVAVFALKRVDESIIIVSKWTPIISNHMISSCYLEKRTWKVSERDAM